MINIYLTGFCVFMFVEYVFVIHDTTWHCHSEELRLVHTTAAGFVDQTTDSDLKYSFYVRKTFYVLNDISRNSKIR